MQAFVLEDTKRRDVYMRVYVEHADLEERTHTCEAMRVSAFCIERWQEIIPDPEGWMLLSLERVTVKSRIRDIWKGFVLEGVFCLERTEDKETDT